MPKKFPSIHVFVQQTWEKHELPRLIHCANLPNKPQPECLSLVLISPAVKASVTHRFAQPEANPFDAPVCPAKPIRHSGRVVAPQAPDVFFGQSKKEKPHKPVSTFARLAAATTLAGGLMISGSAAGQLASETAPPAKTPAISSESPKTEIKPSEEPLDEETLLLLLISVGLAAAAIGTNLQNIEAIRAAAKKLKNPPLAIANVLGSTHPFILLLLGTSSPIVASQYALGIPGLVGQALLYQNENKPKGEKVEWDFERFFEAASQLKRNPANREAHKRLRQELAGMLGFTWQETLKVLRSFKSEKDLLRAIKNKDSLKEMQPALAKGAAKLSLLTFILTELTAVLAQFSGASTAAQGLRTAAQATSGVGSAASLAPIAIRGFSNRKLLAGNFLMLGTLLSATGALSATVADPKTAQLLLGIQYIANAGLFYGSQILHSRYRALEDALAWARKQKGMTPKKLLESLEYESAQQLQLLGKVGAAEAFKQRVKEADTLTNVVPLDLALREPEAFFEPALSKFSKQLKAAHAAKKSGKSIGIRDLLETEKLATELSRTLLYYQAIQKNGHALKPAQKKTAQEASETGLMALAAWIDLLRRFAGDDYDIRQELPTLEDFFVVLHDEMLKLFVNDADRSSEPTRKAHANKFQTLLQVITTFEKDAETGENIEKALTALHTILFTYQQQLQRNEISVFSREAFILREHFKQTSMCFTQLERRPYVINGSQVKFLREATEYKKTYHEIFQQLSREFQETTQKYIRLETENYVDKALAIA
jgi:hypothetical protein